MKNKFKLITLFASMFFLSACTPKVGSPEWCEMIKEKDKGDWTVNEGKDFLNYCVLKNKIED